MQSMSWSREQLGMLQAMEFTPMQLRARAGAAPPDVDRTHPLFPAVCRAAGIRLERASGQQLAQWARQVGLPPLPGLATDPVAKRGLWRRIRRLRGSGQG